MAEQTGGPVQVTLVLETEADARELEELTARLRRELLALDVEAVERAPAGPAPEGTRAVDLAAIGTLLVTLGKGAAALAPLVAAVRSWLSARGAGTVKMQIGGDTIEVTGALSAEQRALVDAWIAAHARR
jgi:hypothetical protein